MKVGLIIPIGVTRETVERITSIRGLSNPDVILGVSVKGFEDLKKPIVEGLRIYSRLVGAVFEYLVLEPWSPDNARLVYEFLVRHRPDKIILVGVTGSRHILFLMFPALLRYWKKTSAELLVLHGVEGEETRLEPLIGYLSLGIRITRAQERLLKIIYESEETLSGKTLIEKYGYGRSVYKVLASLEKLGLVKIKRNRIEKTFPGRLVYEIMKVGGDES